MKRSVKKSLGVTCIIIAIYLTSYIVIIIPTMAPALVGIVGVLYMSGMALLGIKSAANLVSKNIDKKKSEC